MTNSTERANAEDHSYHVSGGYVARDCRMCWPRIAEFAERAQRAEGPAAAVFDEQRAGAEVDADTIGPDTIHKCAGGCGFLVRHGEPHICEPMCNCRPQTRVLGTPWNHTPGCAFEVEPDLRLKHRCSDCPPDTRQGTGRSTQG